MQEHCPWRLVERPQRLQRASGIKLIIFKLSVFTACLSGYHVFPFHGMIYQKSFPSFPNGNCLVNYIWSESLMSSGEAVMSKVREKDQSQRTLLNFDVVDPFEAPSIEVFKDQFRRLHGHNPSAVDLSSYYRLHPQELAKRHGPAKKR